MIITIDSVSIPKTAKEALSNSVWWDAMLEDIHDLHENHISDLVDLPKGNLPLGCKCVFTFKVNYNSIIATLNDRLVAKGYAQTCRVHYSDSFSPVAKLTSVRFFISLVSSQHWPLNELDIKNALLHGDLHEEVYMEQPHVFVAQGE